jgi:hypothetical protein
MKRVALISIAAIGMGFFRVAVNYKFDWWR